MQLYCVFMNNAMSPNDGACTTYGTGTSTGFFTMTSL